MRLWIFPCPRARPGRAELLPGVEVLLPLPLLVLVRPWAVGEVTGSGCHVLQITPKCFRERLVGAVRIMLLLRLQAWQLLLGGKGVIHVSGGPGTGASARLAKPGRIVTGSSIGRRKHAGRAKLLMPSYGTKLFLAKLLMLTLDLFLVAIAAGGRGLRLGGRG